MEGRHTAGPWAAERGGMGGPWQITAGPLATLATVNTHGDNPEADARLIAAAPELLEALLRLLDDECVQFASDAETCECGPNGNGTDDAGNVCGHIQARRAIAKATGQ